MPSRSGRCSRDACTRYKQAVKDAVSTCVRLRAEATDVPESVDLMDFAKRVPFIKS